MATKNPAVDAYIAKARPFAQPILKKLRTLVHKAVPGVTEELKWSSPHFGYKGMFCGMAAFKEHCIFGFWKHSLLEEIALKGNGQGAIGNFRSCITAIGDLPSDAAIIKLLKTAKKLNDDNVQLPKRKVNRSKNRVVRVPPVFMKAINANAKARAAFEKFPYSHKKEYVEWIADAKKPETRDRRIAQAIQWMAAGKSRNWKYERR
ncbi:MAG: hypothetical protein EPO35_00670 [Acidobacteria bacterium]|nr:MAG: hypothetical protein EPO35_00670 [Acidobacteriota bacterium]